MISGIVGWGQAQDQVMIAGTRTGPIWRWVQFTHILKVTYKGFAVNLILDDHAQ